MREGRREIEIYALTWHFNDTNNSVTIAARLTVSPPNYYKL